MGQDIRPRNHLTGQIRNGNARVAVSRSTILSEKAAYSRERLKKDEFEAAIVVRFAGEGREAKSQNRSVRGVGPLETRHTTVTIPSLQSYPVRNLHFTQHTVSTPSFTPPSPPPLSITFPITSHTIKHNPFLPSFLPSSSSKNQKKTILYYINPSIPPKVPY